MGFDPRLQQPDFLTGAFNTLKGFGQGVQDALGAASQAHVIGGALQAVGTIGNIATAPFGLPALLDPSAQQAAVRAYRTQGGDVPSVLDVPAVGRALTAARDQRAAELAQIAENQNTDLGERGKAALGQALYGAVPNFAPVKILPPGTGGALAGAVGAAADLNSVARAVRPAGVIATRLDELGQYGLSDAEKVRAVTHEFGADAAQKYLTTGEDVVISPTVSVPASAEQIASTRGVVSNAQRSFSDNLAREVAAREAATSGIGPKMGAGAARENLGVNLDKIDAPQPVKDYIRTVAEANDGFEAQRRGVITTSETQAAANKVAVEAETYAYLQPGTALNAEQIKAVRDALVTKGRDVTQLQDAVRAEEAAGVVSKETQLRLFAAAAEHQTLQRVYAGARAESGRALRIQREISDGLDRGDVNATYSRAVELLGGKDNADLLIKRMQDIWTDPKLDPVSRETATYKFLQNLDRASTADKVQELWLNAVLSAPLTHVVNVTGQTLLHIADVSTNFLTAAVEAVSTLGGLRRARERTFSGAFGALASTGEGFRRGVKNLQDAEAVAATKFRETGRLRQGQAIGSGFNASGAERAIGAVVNVPTKLLGAEDAVFRGIGSARGLYESAFEVAAREGVKPFSAKFAQRVGELLQNPTDEMIAHADEVGQRAALRMEGGAGTKAIIKLRDAVDVGGFKPLRYVIPFVTTPINLVKIGAEYSPAGFVQAIRKTGGARSEAIARAGLGSSAMAYFAQQFALGNVTGPAPQDPAAKDAFYASGKIPFAVNLGGTWYSYSRLEPVATPLKWTAALMQTAQDDPSASWDVTAGKMVFAMSRMMEDSTYLSGLSAFVDALSDPSKATKLVEQIVGGFNPAIVRNIVQSNDPYIRDPKNIVQQIEATLPYLNEQVPVKQTVFGEPATRTEGKQGISGVINPVDFSQEKADPVTAKVMSYKLPESIGPDGQPLPARGLNVGFVSQDIASFHLTPDEGRRYQTLAGQATKNLLEKLFADQLPYDTAAGPVAFSKLTYEDQIRAIRKTVSDAREVGRGQAADEFMAAATNDGQRARAAQMRLSTIGKMRDQARYLAGLKLQGQLTPEVARQIDANRGANDPTVSEFVQAAPIIDQYVNTPPYLIGNEQEWAALRVARKRAADYADATNKPANVPEWRWYAQVDPQGAALIRVYGRQQLRSPQRIALLRQYPWLDSFVSGA